MTSPALIASKLAENLRDAALAGYDSIAGAPTKPTGVLHHDGSLPTLDCGDLLIVMVTGLTSAFSGPPEACAVVLNVGLSATVTRCVPNLGAGGILTQAEYTDAAKSLAADASVLWHGVVGACVAGTLWSSFQGLRCADTSFRVMRPGALGGIGWWTWDMVVNVTAPLS